MKENNGRKNTLVAQNVCFQMLEYLRHQPRFRIKFKHSSEILLHSQKLRYFRGSRFLTMFILSTALKLLVTKTVFMQTIILSNYQKCPVPLKQNYASTAHIIMFFTGHSKHRKSQYKQSLERGPWSHRAVTEKFNGKH